MALAQSMGEPPPKATTASGRKSANARAPRATRAKEGSGTTSVNRSTVQPVRRAVTRSSSPELDKNASVMTITRFPASASSAASASGPK